MVRRARDYEPGEQVPGTVYQVLRVIGVGGMGTVYDVEDTSVGKRFVLKTLHPQLGARQDLAHRMRKEARTLGRLNHPNIVEVITAGVTGDDLRLPYYVMERLDGQSLRLVLEKKWQLELAHAYHIAIDLLDALDHAHDKNVIHRDVKPDNIFLHRTPAGITITKLLDFGILSQIDSGSRETAGRFLGTLRYAAPEQLRGERPTPLVDVYAAGLVLYEMIAGRGPFDDEGDPHRIAAAHLDKIPPPVSRFVAVPRELERLLVATLAKSPAKRPPDAFSFAASLRNLKGMLSNRQPGESTHSRATAAALAGLQPVVSQRNADDTLPGRGDVSMHDLPEGPDTRFPDTTLQGMTPPTLGVSLAQPITASPVETAPILAPAAVDRIGPTASLPPRTPRASSWGTEAFAPTVPPTPFRDALSPPSLLPEVRPSPVAPFHWPVEARVARSEEPHVHTVPPHSRRFRASFLVGTIATSVVVGCIAVGVVARQRIGRANAFLRESAGDAVVVANSAVLAAGGTHLPVPSVVATAAPMIPAPAVASSPPAMTEAKPRPAAPLPLHPAGGRPSAKASSAVLDRPGPGF
jgi:serine/threonine protein kinase